MQKGLVVAHPGASVLKLRNALVVASQDHDTFSHSNPSSIASILAIVNLRVFWHPDKGDGCETRLVKNDVPFTKHLRAHLHATVDNAFAVTAISENNPHL